MSVRGASGAPRHGAGRRRRRRRLVGLEPRHRRERRLRRRERASVASAAAGARLITPPRSLLLGTGCLRRDGRRAGDHHGDVLRVEPARRGGVRRRAGRAVRRRGRGAREGPAHGARAAAVQVPVPADAADRAEPERRSLPRGPPAPDRSERAAVADAARGDAHVRSAPARVPADDAEQDELELEIFPQAEFNVANSNARVVRRLAAAVQGAG